MSQFRRLGIIIALVAAVSLAYARPSVAQLTTNLVADYRFENAASDATGNFNATNYGAVCTAGKFGNAFFFDGSSAYVAMPTGATDGLSAFTVSLWVKTDEIRTASPTWQNPTLFGFATAGPSSGDFQIVTDTGFAGYYHGLNGTGDQFCISSVDVNDNKWHHIAVVNNGSTAKLYVDGADTSCDTPTGLPLASGDPSRPAHLHLLAAGSHASLGR